MAKIIVSSCRINVDRMESKDSTSVVLTFSLSFSLSMSSSPLAVVEEESGDCDSIVAWRDEEECNCDCDCDCECDCEGLWLFSELLLRRWMGGIGPHGNGNNRRPFMAKAYACVDATAPNTTSTATHVHAPVRTIIVYGRCLPMCNVLVCEGWCRSIDQWYGSIANSDGWDQTLNTKKTPKQMKKERVTSSFSSRFRWFCDV